MLYLQGFSNVSHSLVDKIYNWNYVVVSSFFIMLGFMMLDRGCRVMAFLAERTNFLAYQAEEADDDDDDDDDGDEDDGEVAGLELLDESKKTEQNTYLIPIPNRL